MTTRSRKINLYTKSRVADFNVENLKLWQKFKMDMTLRELSIGTIKAYESDLYQWFTYICDNQSNQNIKELTEDDLTEFFYYCKINGNNSARMRRRMATIASFYKFLRKKRLITENPTEFLDRPKNNTPILTQTFLTKEQIDLLRQKLIEYGNLQLRTYILFSLSTMARVNAVANVRWDMIDFDKRVVHNVLEKEGKIVDLFFSNEVKSLLLQLRGNRKRNGINDYGWVFYSPYCTATRPITTATLTNWSHTAGSLIGIESLHPHDLRHSGASLLKNAGMAIEDISTLLHHSDTSVTAKYYLKIDTNRITQLKDLYSF